MKFDGESHDLILESANLGGVLGLGPQLFPKAIDFHSPPALMGFFPDLSPLGPGAGFRSGRFGGVYLLGHLGSVGRHFG